MKVKFFGFGNTSAAKSAAIHINKTYNKSEKLRAWGALRTGQRTCVSWLQVSVWFAFEFPNHRLTCSNALVNCGNPLATSQFASISPSRIGDRDVALLIQFYGKKRFNETSSVYAEKFTNHWRAARSKKNHRSAAGRRDRFNGRNSRSTERKALKLFTRWNLRIDPRQSSAGHRSV